MSVCTITCLLWYFHLFCSIWSPTCATIPSISTMVCPVLEQWDKSQYLEKPLHADLSALRKRSRQFKTKSLLSITNWPGRWIIHSYMGFLVWSWIQIQSQFWVKPYFFSKVGLSTIFVALSCSDYWNAHNWTGVHIKLPNIIWIGHINNIPTIFHWTSQKYLVKFFYVIIEWVCLGFPKQCNLGYSTTCLIVAHFSYGYAVYNKSVNGTGDFPYIRYVIQNGRGIA